VSLRVRDLVFLSAVEGVTLATEARPTVQIAGEPATCNFATAAVVVADAGRGAVTLSCTAPARGGASRKLPEGIIGDVVVTNPVLPGATGGEADVLGGGFTYEDGFANESDLPLELDFCNLQAQEPVAGTRNVTVYSRVYEGGRTDTADGRAPGIDAEFGVAAAPLPSSVLAVTWTPATYNALGGTTNDDEYMATFVPPAGAGTYRWLFRYTLDGGLNWTYCDSDGAGSNGGLTFTLANAGTITVAP